MIRAARIFWLQTRLLYLRAVLNRIPSTHAEWSRVFWELVDVEARLWAAWDA